MGRTESSEHTYTPLPKVEAEAPRIKLALHLPDYVNQNEIGLRLRRIHRMMWTGGISSITVIGESGEVSSTSPTVVGHSPDGSAYAGKKATKKLVPTFQSEKTGQIFKHEPKFIAGRWTDARIYLNLSEIQQRLSQKGQLRSSGAWAEVLDIALRRGIVKEGFNHLSKNVTQTDFRQVLIPLLGGIATQVFVPALGFGIGAFITHAVINIRNKRIYDRGDYDTDGFRRSLFVGPQLDRAVVLWTAGKTGKVAKVLPKEEGK